MDASLSEGIQRKTSNKKLLGAPGHTTRSKKLLGTKGIATGGKDATNGAFLLLVRYSQIGTSIFRPSLSPEHHPSDPFEDAMCENR